MNINPVTEGQGFFILWFGEEVLMIEGGLWVTKAHKNPLFRNQNCLIMFTNASLGFNNKNKWWCLRTLQSALHNFISNMCFKMSWGKPHVFLFSKGMEIFFHLITRVEKLKISSAHHVGAMLWEEHGFKKSKKACTHTLRKFNKDSIWMWDPDLTKIQVGSKRLY